MELNYTPKKIPSLKGIKKTEPEKETANIEVSSAEDTTTPAEKEHTDLLPPTDNNLKTLLNLFVETDQVQGRPSLTHLLKNSNPVAKDGCLLFVFQSEQQTKLFEEVRPVVLGFFNSRLSEKLDRVEMEVDESVKLGTDKPYTPNEVFEYLKKKNPALKEAEEKWGLRVK